MSTSPVTGEPGTPDRDWRKSTRCANAGCVEVGVQGGQIQVRDSKQPGSPILSFDPDEWRAFVAGVKDSEFDF